MCALFAYITLMHRLVLVVRSRMVLGLGACCGHHAALYQLKQASTRCCYSASFPLLPQVCAIALRLVHAAPAAAAAAAAC
jgi:hypothetical protein